MNYEIDEGQGCEINAHILLNLFHFYILSEKIEIVSFSEYIPIFIINLEIYSKTE